MATSPILQYQQAVSTKMLRFKEPYRASQTLMRVLTQREMSTESSRATINQFMSNASPVWLTTFLHYTWHQIQPIVLHTSDAHGLRSVHRCGRYWVLYLAPQELLVLFIPLQARLRHRTSNNLQLRAAVAVRRPAVAATPLLTITSCTRPWLGLED